MKPHSKTQKSGKPDEDFVRSFALEYADFSAKRAEFAVKLECAKAYSSAVYSGSQNISDARSDLLKTASIYKEKEIKAAFAGLSGDLKLASMVSLSELFGAELSPSQKALKHIALISQAQAIDSSVAERMLWHTHSEIYLKGHTEKFADVLREALKSVRDESKSTLDAQTVTFKKGKVVLDKSGRPVEEKLIDAGVRKNSVMRIQKLKCFLPRHLLRLSRMIQKRRQNFSSRRQSKSFQSGKLQTRESGEAVYANTGISPSQWKEVVADAAVLGMGVIGAKVGGPAAPLAASAYFAVKGGFYTHLGIVTKNNDLVLAGMLMMAPLMLGTAAKGMLAVASRSGSEALTTGAYSLVLSERAIGVYFTGSMGYNAIRGAVEGAKYGYTPELVKETVQNAVFGAFGLGVATGRLSAVKSSLKEALEGAKVIGVGQGIKKGSGAKVIPIRTEVERPAEAVEVGREGMGGKNFIIQDQHQTSVMGLRVLQIKDLFSPQEADVVLKRQIEGQ